MHLKRQYLQQQKNHPKKEAWNYAVPSVNLGEDGASYKRNILRLKAEYKKAKPNKVIVNDLMTRTFPMRRNEILNSPSSLSNTFDKFPFLQDSNQVCDMMWI